MNEPIDVIVPYGHVPGQDEREANAHHVIGCLRRQDVRDVRIVLAELSAEPSQQAWAEDHCDEYIFSRLRAGEPFSPGRAQNLGFARRSSPADLVLVHQADFVVGPDWLGAALEVRSRTQAPFVYPHWGEVHLSRPLSAAIRRHEVSGDDVLDAFRRLFDASAFDHDGRDRPPTHDGLALLDPGPAEAADLVATLGHLGFDPTAHDDPWGHDDRPFDRWRWPSAGAAPITTICRMSGGPRASASYLTSTHDYARIGGAWELQGWGFEDLLTWSKVQALHPYAAPWQGIRFDGTLVSVHRPLVHLWHPVDQQRAYYEHADANEREFRRFTGLPPADQRELVARHAATLGSGPTFAERGGEVGGQ